MCAVLSYACRHGEGLEKGEVRTDWISSWQRRWVTDKRGTLNVKTNESGVIELDVG